jgi:hypothetical protein
MTSQYGQSPFVNRVILSAMKLLISASIWLIATAWAAAQQPADPVGHPAGYQSFQQVRSFDRKQEPAHGTVFLNAQAASITTAGQPYPYGSVLIMEWRRAGKDSEIVRLDVMRKERGYGAAYGADKNGDWEYASYSPDGKLTTDAAASLACAKCHLKAGDGKDFVYIGRFAPTP